ncbi:MAG TPA: DUF4197 domain-containing protein [Flavobacteriaceae bacterium]|nr:DUF4197 domain-containing protein [Flavobacteriaceae bacterium]
MKRFSVVLCVLLFFSCAELKDYAENLPGRELSQSQIANGLKEALDNGIEKQVTKLTKTDGFYRNEMVKILLPAELQKVESGLRSIGLDNLADEGIKALNRAAEDAVGRATPIFVDAVKEMTFTDAKSILMGDDNSATAYLEDKTESKLYDEFNPVIKSSFDRVGADQIWSNLISRYNQIPFVEKVNPDLTDYVTHQALNGVYTMIGEEEKDIRNNISARTSTLLRQVFALQDKE